MNPTRVKLMPRSAPQGFALYLLIMGGMLLGLEKWPLGAGVLLASALLWRSSRGWIEVGPFELTVHLSLTPAIRIPRTQIAATEAGTDLDPGDALMLPAENTRPVSLVLRLTAPVVVGRGKNKQEATALALVALKPERAAAALGVPVDDRPAPPAVVERRRKQRRDRRAPFLAHILVPLVTAPVLYAFGAFDESRGADRSPFAALPSLPDALTTYHGLLGDGVAVHAWRTSADTARVRIDIPRAKCSGAKWTEADHTTDLAGLKLDAAGRFHRRAHLRQRFYGGLDLTTVELRGVMTASAVRGTLVRVDDNRGEWQAVCRRTIRFAAQAG